MSAKTSGFPGVLAGALRASTGAVRRWPMRLPHVGGIALLLSDILAIEASFLAATTLVGQLGGLRIWGPASATTAGIAMVALHAGLGLFDPVGRSPVGRFRLRVLGGTLLPPLALALFVLAGGPAHPAAAALVLTAILGLPLGLLLESIVREALIERAAWGATALLISTDQAALRLAEHLITHPELGLKPIGYVGDAPGNEPLPVPWLGSLSTTEYVADAADVAIIIGHRHASPIDPMRLPFRRVFLVSMVGVAPALWLSAHGFSDAAALELRNRALSTADSQLKRVLDLLIAVPALFLSLPLLGLFALMIRLASPGPAFYRQQRVGLRGEPVVILKLRTMHRDAEARLQSLLEHDPEARREWEHSVKLSRDPRILPVIGTFLRRSSLDELPQLWNVVRGELSLVGPRPFPQYHVNRFSPEFQALRASVKPGLTGLWQVSERSDADLQQQQAIDTLYVRNWSLWLDLYIVFKTFPAMISARGAR